MASQGYVIVAPNRRGMPGHGTAWNEQISGDWGGVVILGLAKNNQPGGVANIEGIVPTTDSQYGGSFDNDNSGVMKYCRIEFSPLVQFYQSLQLCLCSRTLLRVLSEKT